MPNQEMNEQRLMTNQQPTMFKQINRANDSQLNSKINRTNDQSFNSQIEFPNTRSATYQIEGSILNEPILDKLTSSAPI